MRPFFVSPPISVPSSFRLTALVQITTSNIPSNVLFLFRLDTHTILSRSPHSIHCQSSLLHHFIPHPSAPITADVIPSNVLSHRYIWFQLNVLDGTKRILKHILFHLKRFHRTKCLCQWVLSRVKRFLGTKLKIPGPTSRQYVVLKKTCTH